MKLFRKSWYCLRFLFKKIRMNSDQAVIPRFWESINAFLLSSVTFFMKSWIQFEQEYLQYCKATLDSALWGNHIQLSIYQYFKVLANFNILLIVSPLYWNFVTQRSSHLTKSFFPIITSLKNLYAVSCFGRIYLTLSY